MRKDLTGKNAAKSLEKRILGDKLMGTAYEMIKDKLNTIINEMSASPGLFVK